MAPTTRPSARRRCVVALLAALAGALSTVWVPAVRGRRSDRRSRGRPRGRPTFATSPTASARLRRCTYSCPRPASVTRSLGLHRHGRRAGDGGGPDQGALHLAGPARLVPGHHAARHDRQRRGRRAPSSARAADLLHHPVQRVHLRRRGDVRQRAAAGDTYGFRLSGSNSDSNNFLRAPSRSASKPFLDATIGTDNRDWPGAEDSPTGRHPPSPGHRGVRRGPLVQVPGRARPGRQGILGSSGVDNLPADYDLALYGDIGEPSTSW